MTRDELIETLARAMYRYECGEVISPFERQDKPLRDRFLRAATAQLAALDAAGLAVIDIDRATEAMAEYVDSDYFADGYINAVLAGRVDQ
jgi:hypothetical protein